MESTSKSNHIHCSEYSAVLLREQCPKIQLAPRGSIDVKGKGLMCTYWVYEGMKELSSWEEESTGDTDGDEVVSV
jgi:Adenylate and Guanylate cyclase catalytic domain